MKVSVIIPTYNYGRFLRAAVESVQRQTLGDLEILVVDDGSTDDTPEVLESIGDPRLRAKRIPNGGPTIARNVGLDMARGELIAFLDADDLWRPTKLARQVAFMDSEPDVGVSFTDFVRFDGERYYPKTQFDFFPELSSVPRRPSANGDGQVITSDAFTTLVSFGHFPAWPQTTMIRASQVGDIRFHADYAPSEDLYYMLRVYRRVPAGFIVEPLVEVRRHGSNSYTTLRQKIDADLRVLIDFQDEELDAEHRLALQRRIARAWCGLGYFHFNTRNPGGAARAYWHALAYPGRRLAALKRLAALPMVPFLSTSQKVDWSAPDEQSTTAAAGEAAAQTSPEPSRHTSRAR